MAVRGWVLAGLVLALPGFARAVGLCPSDADVVVYARNLSADPTVTLALDGELLDPTASCTGEGAPFYETTLTCAGSGLVPCGRLRGLRPGAWVNRVNLTVGGSPAQVQAQSAVFLASAGNVVVWTIYPRTFVVTEATEADVLEQIALAEDSPAKPALVTFARAAFPGAAAPQTVTFTDRTRVCDPDNHNCSAIRLTGSQVVVDALDARAQPGAVVLSVGVLRHSLVRILGSGNVLRGLVLQGTRNDTPLSQYDTVAISGPDASGTRIEQSIVYGPTMGDAVGVDAGGLPGGASLEPTVIERCELSGARDKGIKANGTSVQILQSCVHDNGNGGVQSTLGGRVVATDNVVQHNVPGAAQNGLSVGGPPGGPENRSTLVSSGNIVRFAGSRGLSVADNSDATFANDFVSDAQFAGARVETKVVETVPTARFRGVALVCNQNAGITGVCRPRIGFDDLVCATDADCCGPDLGCCRNDPGCTTPAVCAPTGAVDGFGAVVATDCPECSPPQVDFGNRAEGGANAFALNRSLAPDSAGINLKLSLADVAPGALVVDAYGNQWEHCGPAASCGLPGIQNFDIQATGGRVDPGTPVSPRTGTPAPLTHSPGRPAAGEVVRIFGSGFNAIDGAACSTGAAPAEPCAIDNPNVAGVNSCPHTGNCVQLLIAGQTVPVDVAAVTPTMLAFRMPFDCFAPATVRVARQGIDGRTIAGTTPFCDTSGCLGLAANEPCEDGNRCTVFDHCRGSGAECVPGVPVVCACVCLSGACDPASGCVPSPASAPCDDGDPCTAGDHCSGTDGTCVPGTNPCAGPCRTGVCGPGGTCTPLPVTTPCDDGDPCTLEDHCAADGLCTGGRRVTCDDGDPCSRDTCDGRGACLHPPMRDFEAITCRATIVQTAASATPGGNRLGRAVARAADETVRAQQAKRQGDLHAALARLGHARSRLRAALALLRAQSRLSVAERRTLRDVVRAALAEVQAQRDTIVEALSNLAALARCPLIVSTYPVC